MSKNDKNDKIDKSDKSDKSDKIDKNDKIDKKNLKEYVFKIIVIGDTNTGKSSFIQRFVYDKFTANYKPTIGVDFVTRTIQFEEDVTVQVQIWDIAGQERFGGMTRIYYKDAAGCLLLFDLSNYPTFESVRKWKQDLDSKINLPDGKQIPCVLVGNKSDLSKDLRITSNDLNELIQTGFTGFCRVSTKTNHNVSEAVNILISDIIRKRDDQVGPVEPADVLGDSIKIEEVQVKPKLKCSSC